MPTTNTWYDRIWQGEDVRRVVWEEDPETGVYTDFTGVTFRAALLTRVGEVYTTVIAIDCAVIDNPYTNAANPVVTNRAFEMLIDRTDTVDLVPRGYIFEVWITDAAGEESPYGEPGVMEVYQTGLHS